MREEKPKGKFVRVQEIMSKPVVTCGPDMNVAAAAELMFKANIGALPVVEGARPIGLVTDRDLFIALGTSNQRASDVAVGQVMRTGLSLCNPEDDVRTALKTMAQQQIHRLPVVDQEGALTGILSLNDVALRAGADGLSNDDVARTLGAICGHPQGPKALQTQSVRVA